MAGVSIDDFGASFIHYLPDVIKQLNTSSPAREVPLGVATKKWEGSRLSKFIHLSQNPAIASIGDGGALPVAGKNGYEEAYIKRKFIAGSVQITDGQLRNAASTKHAAVSALKSELEGLMDGIRKYESFFFTRDGTGIVATLGADADPVTTGVITVSDARGIWRNAKYRVHDDTSTPTTPVTHYSFTASKVARAPSSGEATVTTTDYGLVGSAATGDYVVWRGTSDSDSFGLLPTGLDKLIDDSVSSSFQNISLSTYPEYTSPVLTANSTLSPSLFRRMLAMIAQESRTPVSRSSHTVITSMFDTVSFSEMYESELRITPDTKTVGSKYMSFATPYGEFELRHLWDAPYGKIFFVNRKEITRAVQQELEWRKSDGGGIMTKSSNAAYYTADALAIYEYMIERRSSCGKIEGLTVTKDTMY